MNYKQSWCWQIFFNCVFLRITFYKSTSQGEKQLKYWLKTQTKKTTSLVIYTWHLLKSRKLLLYSIFSQWEVCEFLLLLLGLKRCLMLSKSTSHGTCLLGSEIKRFKLLGFVELTQVFTLSLADNSQNSSNGFTNKFSAKRHIPS